MLHFKVVFSELNSKKKKIVKWPKHTLKNLQSTKTFEQFVLQETHKLKYVKKLQSPKFQQFFLKLSWLVQVLVKCAKLQKYHIELKRLVDEEKMNANAKHFLLPASQM